MASPLAQSTDERAAAAHGYTRQMLEEWLGPPSATIAPPSLVRSAFPASPMTMDVERQAAMATARQWWPHQPLMLADAASRYLADRITTRLFDLSFGRAGAGVDSLALFGGTFTFSLPALRFDSPAAALDLGRESTPIHRAARAFASLERVVGQPRFIGALRAAAERQPASDAEFIDSLNASLAQDVSWIFAAAVNPAPMNYAIANVATEPCTPAPCTRVRVDVTHQGPVFAGVDASVEFADGQVAVATWHGRDAGHVFVFEGPSEPIRISLDPDARNLLDDNLNDQSKRPGGRTNVALSKWMSRWIVWLQNAMLAYSAIV